MNDPHGMFQLKDTVHLFFQYNPRSLAWGEDRDSSSSSGSSSSRHGTAQQADVRTAQGGSSVQE
jgi:hypothetical protein